ncbi:MAG: alpha/beta hydrolase [Roseiflexaceae bacterium]
MSTETGFTQAGQFASANGLKIYYQEAGSGEPVLLLHGGTATSNSWQDFVPMLAQQFRVIAPDLRGHGRTANPTGELSYRLLADDAAALVQALGLTKPLMVGYSDGGQTLLEFGMHYPDLARALVLGGTTHAFSDAYYRTLDEWGFEAPGVVNMDKIRTSMDDMIEYMQTEHAALGGPDYWQTLLQQISTMWLTPLNYTNADLQRISVPTLVALGDRDDAIPVQQAVDMYHILPNAELAIFPNENHGTSAHFMQIVTDFLMRQHTQPA